MKNIYSIASLFNNSSVSEYQINTA